MNLRSFVGYFFAGVFFTNGLPHLLIALTGRRNLTPFGKDSSPLVNLLWGGLNFTGGYLFARLADKQQDENNAKSNAWQFPYGIGCLAFSIFGTLYSWFAARQKAH